MLAARIEVPQPHAFLSCRPGRGGEATGARAVLLDADGNVAETTTANVLVVRDGEGLVSPPREHILAGVSLERCPRTGRRDRRALRHAPAGGR